MGACFYASSCFRVGMTKQHNNQEQEQQALKYKLFTSFFYVLEVLKFSHS